MHHDLFVAMGYRLCTGMGINRAQDAVMDQRQMMNLFRHAFLMVVRHVFFCIEANDYLLDARELALNAICNLICHL